MRKPLSSDDLANPADKRVVSLAQQWGFQCSLEQGTWQISPQQSGIWRLQVGDGGWFLFVRGVAQIRFQNSEALLFLQRQLETQSQRHPSSGTFYKVPDEGCRWLFRE